MLALDRVSQKICAARSRNSRTGVILDVMRDGLPTTLFTSILATLWQAAAEQLHMRDGDVREQILALEAQIERLAEVVESCRKVILISKAFTAVGGILMLAMTIGIVRFDPMIMIGALTAVIGGIVLLGSNWSTSQQSTAALKAAEAQRAELIGKIDLQVVEGTNDGALRLN
jgi:hypothetical protein